MALLLGVTSYGRNKHQLTAVTNFKLHYHDAFVPFILKWNIYSISEWSTALNTWQNRADYVLTAKLNDVKNEIVGTDIITYTIIVLIK
jgi:hypothetical protein